MIELNGYKLYSMNIACRGDEKWKKSARSRFCRDHAMSEIEVKQ